MARHPAPAGWADKERSYLAKVPKLSGKAALHGWQHESQKLAHWFHAEVRSRGEPSLCAYCDGQLGETSPRTIDHFLPEESFPELGLSWHNLYPACYSCNTLHKRTQWSCSLLRPDSDLVSPEEDPSVLAVFKKWFDFEPMTGALSAAPDAPRAMRARVRLTIRVLGLNERSRCNARKNRWQDLRNAVKHPLDEPRLDEMTRLGPYRFVAIYFVAFHEGQKALPR
ncbi:MAG: HNH endonuclease [Byssovorax sp.]